MFFLDVDVDVDVVLDNDYVIGGIGVVKVFVCCFKNRGDDIFLYFVFELLVGEVDQVFLGDGEKEFIIVVVKVKDMSKYLLFSVCKIWLRFQFVIVKVKMVVNDSYIYCMCFFLQFYRNILMLIVVVDCFMFLDNILYGIIKCFEDEFFDICLLVVDDLGVDIVSIIVGNDKGDVVFLFFFDNVNGKLFSLVFGFIFFFLIDLDFLVSYIVVIIFDVEDDVVV